MRCVRIVLAATLGLACARGSEANPEFDVSAAWKLPEFAAEVTSLQIEVAEKPGSPHRIRSITCEHGGVDIDYSGGWRVFVPAWDVRPGTLVVQVQYGGRDLEDRWIDLHVPVPDLPPEWRSYLQGAGHGLRVGLPDDHVPWEWDLTCGKQRSSANPEAWTDGKLRFVWTGAGLTGGRSSSGTLSIEPTSAVLLIEPSELFASTDRGATLTRTLSLDGVWGPVDCRLDGQVFDRASAAVTLVGAADRVPWTPSPAGSGILVIVRSAAGSDHVVAWRLVPDGVPLRDVRWVAGVYEVARRGGGRACGPYSLTGEPGGSFYDSELPTYRIVLVDGRGGAKVETTYDATDADVACPSSVDLLRPKIRAAPPFERIASWARNGGGGAL